MSDLSEAVERYEGHREDSNDLQTIAADYLRMREELIALKDRHLDSCDGRWLDTRIDEILNPKGDES